MKPTMLAMLVGLALIIQCQHGTRPAAPPETTTTRESSPKRLACHDVCWRTFRDCMSQMLLATGKVTRAQLERFVRAGLWDAARLVGYTGCMRRCGQGQAQGQPERTSAVGRCLKLRSCTAFAACMIPPRASAR